MWGIARLAEIVNLEVAELIFFILVASSFIRKACEGFLVCRKVLQRLKIFAFASADRGPVYLEF